MSTIRYNLADQKLTTVTVFREEKVTPEVEAALYDRDGDKCCITGSADVVPTYIIAPSIVDDKDLQPGVDWHAPSSFRELPANSPGCRDICVLS